MDLGVVEEQDDVPPLKGAILPNAAHHLLEEVLEHSRVHASLNQLVGDDLVLAYGREHAHRVVLLA